MDDIKDVVDNSRLEELLKKEITPEMQREVFEALKDAQLYLPVIFSDNMFEGIEDAKEGDVFQTTGREGFDINYLTMENEEKAVPLFTSDNAMEAGGARSSAMVMFASDIAELLAQSDRYSLIAINPFSGNEIIMPIEAFLNIFSKDQIRESLNPIINILKEKSVELEEDYVFYVRGDEPFMKNDAVDGVFKPDFPFNISSREDFHKEMKYLNVLLLPKTTKILFIGNVVDENHYDTIMAPESEFEFVEDLDEFTTVWKCGKQPFYDE